MSDLPSLDACHPGVAAALGATCKRMSRTTAQARRTNEAAKAVKRKYRTYGPDARKVKKVALKTWKSFVGDTKAGSSAQSRHHKSRCYVCKKFLGEGEEDGAAPSVQTCGDCLSLNLEMRGLRADLKGRYAVVTGARVKIGLEVALRLLRDGCFVVATTRFPRSALIRYEKVISAAAIVTAVAVASGA